MTDAMELDAVIFGGGAAGLWTLDELARAGARCLLLEANDLGSGQTVASQGIIHGGLKYTLSGLFSPSARAIAEMPTLWKQCLAGERQPDLSGTKMRSHWCVLWQTASIKSTLGMIGARAGLRITPRKLAVNERPPLLRDCPGIVARLDEQVIEPWSFIAELAKRCKDQLMKIDVRHGLEFVMDRETSADRAGLSEVRIKQVRLINPETGDPLDLHPRFVVFAAGAGNADLRRMCGLSPHAMQSRPLHMVMARGVSLPTLNGHCADGAATRVTITTSRDFSNTPIWQIGGQIAERGVNMDESTLIRFARDEIRAVLPRVELGSVEWATYRVDRAEASVEGGSRPNDMSVLRDGNLMTVWPTKLVLAPRLAEHVRRVIVPDSAADRDVSVHPAVRCPAGWPRPTSALPPWENASITWTRLD